MLEEDNIILLHLWDFFVIIVSLSLWRWQFSAKFLEWSYFVVGFLGWKYFLLDCNRWYFSWISLSMKFLCLVSLWSRGFSFTSGCLLHQRLEEVGDDDDDDDDNDIIIIIIISLQLAISVPCCLLILFYWTIPESPRWLVSKNRIKVSSLSSSSASSASSSSSSPSLSASSSLVPSSSSDYIWLKKTGGSGYSEVRSHCQWEHNTCRWRGTSS